MLVVRADQWAAFRAGHALGGPHRPGVDVTLLAHLPRTDWNGQCPSQPVASHRIAPAPSPGLGGWKPRGPSKPDDSSLREYP